MTLIRSILARGCCTSVLMLSITASAAPLFTVHELAPPPGLDFYPSAITDQGRIAGNLYSGPEIARVAVHDEQRGDASFQWPRSQYSLALGINDRGDVVGFASDYLGYTQAWARHANGEPFNLVDGKRHSEALGINASGAIVGNSGQGGFIWREGNVTWIPGATLTAINASGAVVGVGRSPTYANQPLLWRDGETVWLPFPAKAGPYARGSATAVNARGDVTGWCVMKAHQEMQGCLWRDGAVELIGALEPGLRVEPTGINDAGVVVGSANRGTPDEQHSEAFVKLPGKPIASLDDLIDKPGPSFSSASAINNAGQILAVGYESGLVRKAYRLDPIGGALTVGGD